MLAEIRLRRWGSILNLVAPGLGALASRATVDGSPVSCVDALAILATTTVTAVRKPLGPSGTHNEHRLAPSAEGLRHNLRLFLLLILQVFFVGAMVGVERTVLPVIAKEEFGLSSNVAVLSFIFAFGLAKAPGNLIAGHLADSFGRRRVLIGGWAIALPVPLLIAFAPSWGWVIFANVLLGAQQAFCWSTTIFMKVDVSGPRRRGLVIGANEFAGYAGAAVLAYLTGRLAAATGARVWPFLIGEAFALAGFITAFVTTIETNQTPAERSSVPIASSTKSFALLSQAGLITKVVDVVAWGLLPLYLNEQGLGVATIAILAAAYPASWATLQILTGAWSDRIGRRTPIVLGMSLQGVGLFAVARAGSFSGWLVGVMVLGAGTALVYPTLIAAAADLAPVGARASLIGRYRFVRDLGFVIGAPSVGYLSDAVGTPTTLLVLTGLVLGSSVLCSTITEAGEVTPQPRPL